MIANLNRGLLLLLRKPVENIPREIQVELPVSYNRLVRCTVDLKENMLAKKLVRGLRGSQNSSIQKYVHCLVSKSVYPLLKNHSVTGFSQALAHKKKSKIRKTIIIQHSDLIEWNHISSTSKRTEIWSPFFGANPSLIRNQSMFIGISCWPPVLSGDSNLLGWVSSWSGEIPPTAVKSRVVLKISVPYKDVMLQW